MCSSYSTWRATIDPTLWASVQCLNYMRSHNWSNVMIQCAVLILHDEPPMIQFAAFILHDESPLIPCYDSVCSVSITWRATTDPILSSSVQCLQYMTSHHWFHVMIQCVVFTLHDEPPLIPCYDPVCSVYITWRATTDAMLWSSVQCLHYMTSHHWSHVMIQCAVLPLNDEPPLIPCYDPVCSFYITWRATTDPMLRSSVHCLHYITLRF
jgi:hypothetical protein